MRRALIALILMAAAAAFLLSGRELAEDSTLTAYVFPWDNYSGPAVGPFRTAPEDRRDGCRVWIYTQDEQAEGFRVNLTYGYAGIEAERHRSELVAREERTQDMFEGWTTHVFEIEGPKAECRGVEVLSLHAYARGR